jgi:hypothetical protein
MSSFCNVATGPRLTNTSPVIVNCLRATFFPMHYRPPQAQMRSEQKEWTSYMPVIRVAFHCDSASRCQTADPVDKYRFPVYSCRGSAIFARPTRKSLLCYWMANSTEREAKKHFFAASSLIGQPMAPHAHHSLTYVIAILGVGGRFPYPSLVS